MNLEPFYKSKEFDYHVHIGQFNDIYFQPHKIIENLYKNGIKGCWFSSTTSCIKAENIEDEKMIYKHILAEVKEALCIAKKIDFDAKALYWVNLDRHKKYKNFTIEKAMSEAKYSGFKIHTKTDYWDVYDKEVCKMFDDVCEYAKEKDVPILIHSGVDECDNPHRFEKWFSKYNTVKFVLAHLKTPNEMIKIMKENNNVFVDTAFAIKENIEKVEQEGLKEKILYGTDYPINKNVYKKF